MNWENTTFWERSSSYSFALRNKERWKRETDKEKGKGRDREIKRRMRDKRIMGCQREKWKRAEGLPWF